MPSHARDDPRSQRSNSGRPGQFEGDDTQQGLITGKVQFARGEFNARTKAALNRKSTAISKIPLKNADQLSFGRGSWMFTRSMVRVTDVGDRRAQTVGSLPFGEGNGATVFSDFSGVARAGALNAPSNELVSLMRWQKSGLSLNDIDFLHMDRNPKHGCTVMHAGTMSVFHSGYERMPFGIPFAVLPPPENDEELEKFLNQLHRPRTDPEGSVRGMVVPVTFERIMSVMEKVGRIITDKDYKLTWKDTFSRLNETTRNAIVDKSFDHQIQFIAAARAQQVIFQFWAFLTISPALSEKERTEAACWLGLIPPRPGVDLNSANAVDAQNAARKLLQMMFSDCMGGQPGVNNADLDLSKLVDADAKKVIRSTQLRAMAMTERAILETARALTSHIRGETMTAAIPGEKFDAITYS